MGYMTTALIVSAASGLYGASEQARAANAQADYSEAMAKINQRFAQSQSEDVLERGREDANRAMRQSRSAMGSQKAGFAAQGIEVNSGTAGEIISQTAEIGARDAARIERNAQLEAWGIRTNSAQAVQQARMQAEGLRNEARSTLVTGGLRAVSDIARAGSYSFGEGSKGEQGRDAYDRSRRYDR
jgi:hypothetical protein